MANPEHVEIVKRGADAIKKWREENPAVRLDLSAVELADEELSEAKLSEAELCSGVVLRMGTLRPVFLRRVDLRRVDLRRADLSNANLRGVDLSNGNAVGADFREAELSMASIVSADLRGVDLRAANLSDAELLGSDLRAADLHGANLRGAVVGMTTFVNVDLSEAKELQNVRHEAPSSIGVDTLVRSGGAIPDEFLKGCGLTEWQVLEAKLYDPVLTAAEITDLQYRIFDKRAHGPFYLGGVFVSYSHADSKFVDKLYQRLLAEGAPVWLDRHDMVAGPLQEQVSRAIRLNDVVLLVLSEASVKSDWVVNELDMARRKEKEENRDVLCPVALDDAWKEKALGHDTTDRQLWRTLTDKNVLDFSRWKTRAFNPQFDKLLRGMKIYYEPKKDQGGAMCLDGDQDSP